MKTVRDKAKEQAVKALKTNEAKWGKLLMSTGWTAAPSILFEKQAALGLDALDINIILFLLTYWWEADNKPHPSKNTIAEALNVSPRTVQRRIASMEAAGFLKREYRPDKDKGNKSNKYSFDGLIQALEPYAMEKLEMIDERKAAEVARIKRRRPRLKSIPGGKD